MPDPDPAHLEILLRQQARWRRAVFLLWAMVLLVILAWTAQPLWWSWLAGGDGTPRRVTPRGELAGDERSTIELFKAAAPGVVYITTTTTTVRPWDRYALDVPRGSGAGFIWDEAGHIVTNYHVLQGADRAFVYFGDHQRVAVNLVGVSPDHDLAVLRLARPVAGISPIPLGSSNDLQVGQKVFAIGNPFGLDQTLTTGVISALHRSIEGPSGLPIEDVIQTDAAINPGNSGGPLLDSAGRLIGVNTAIYSPSGTSAGIGFAIPVDTVNVVVPHLIAHREFRRPVLGIRISDQLNRSLLADTGVAGVVVIAVEGGSVADAAGLRGAVFDAEGIEKIGDVLLAVGGRPVTNRRELLAALGTADIGAPVVLRVWRAGTELELEAHFPRPIEDR